MDQLEHGPSALLRERATAAPDRLALVDGDSRHTWAQLDSAVSAAANALRSRGLQDGDRVALQLRTGADFVVLYLGALRAGLVAVPVNPSYTPPEVEHIRLDSGAALHLDAAGARELLEGASDPRRPGARPHRRAAGRAALHQRHQRPAKGAMLSARALLANLDQLAAVEPPLVTADDVLFVPLPLTHVFGLNAGLGMALRVGATLVLADRFDAGGDARHHGGRARHRGARRARASTRPGSRTRSGRPGSRRCASRCPARRRSRAGSSRAAPPPGWCCTTGTG